MKIKLYNKIAKVGLDQIPGAQFGEDLAEFDGVLVRSAALHDEKFPASLKAIARAGAGVNNIPLDRCTDEGICVFNTPGANANAVKELAVAALLLASRDILGGARWAETLAGDPDAAKKVEKGKSAFAGTEIAGKTLGIFGLGAIGGMLANAASALGMKVMGFDPWLSVPAALRLVPGVTVVSDKNEIFKNSDYISVHVPSTPENRGMINADSIALMKDGAAVINLARADLVNAEDVLAALESGKLKKYVTDFPTPEVIGKKGVVAIPHLGASTEEAEDNCAVMAARQLKVFIENGNVKNSVNFPAASLPRTGAQRLSVLFRGECPAAGQAVAAASSSVCAKRGELGYAIIETADAGAAEKALDGAPGVIRVFRF